MIIFTTMVVGETLEQFKAPPKKEKPPFPHGEWRMPRLESLGDCLIVGAAFYGLHRLFWLIR